MDLRPIYIFLILSMRGPTIRGQILTSKDGLRAEMIKQTLFILYIMYTVRKA